MRATWFLLLSWICFPGPVHGNVRPTLPVGAHVRSYYTRRPGRVAPAIRWFRSRLSGSGGGLWLRFATMVGVCRCWRPGAAVSASPRVDRLVPPSTGGSVVLLANREPFTYATGGRPRIARSALT